MKDKTNTEMAKNNVVGPVFLWIAVQQPVSRAAHWQNLCPALPDFGNGGEGLSLLMKAKPCPTAKAATGRGRHPI
jgi:hypothetical protein